MKNSSLGGALAALSIGLALMLGIVEIGLRLFTPFPITTKSANKIAHPQLGYVMDPHFPEIDRDGFRNPAPPAKAEIVTLGDSMTYGYNVRSFDTWPQQLGRLAGRGVYNYGIGGYGPLQYAWQIDAAIARGPSLILVSFHVGNDLVDVCSSIRSMTLWRDWAIAKGYDAARCGQEEQGGLAVDQTGLGTRVKLMIQQSAMVSAFGYFVVDEWRYAAERSPGPETVVFRDGRNDTYVGEGLNRYNIRNTDLGNPAIILGRDLTVAVYEEMAAKAKAAGIGFGVVFVPTRQSVMAPYLERAGVALPSSYRQSLAQEAALDAYFQQSFDRLGIRWVNARSELQRTVEAETGVYPFREENHPMAGGYAAVARAAHKAFPIP